MPVSSASNHINRHYLELRAEPTVRQVTENEYLKNKITKFVTLSLLLKKVYFINQAQYSDTS